ncbi:MAG TPA: M56 family metallopeptidase [Candidatus Dormibacteraeota bacterium]|jgi:beta-lactamase regulating signal transducer with metallopeptidase domain|nr:M56 family metallopeptidase [Candidatus Dormibacteraeota bacterium]
MIWPQLQSVADLAVARVLNSLPEGLLIALFAWMMLHLLPRQNSGTRFAVWFVALLSIVGLPLIGAAVVDAGAAHEFLTAGTVHPLITLPGHWGTALFLGWLAVACFAMLRLAIGLWHLRELRRSCIPIEAVGLDPTVRSTIANLNLSRPATLTTSERVSVPAVIGFFKPIIVIPAWALRELPSEELNVILLHEFAHLRRWDDWTNLLQKIVRAIFFFHPAVWWIESRLSLEREMACDDQVLAKTGNPRGYAQCLISLLEKSAARRGWAMAQALVHRARESSLRVAQILDAGRPSSKHVWKPALGLVGIFSLVCIAVVPSVPKFVAFSAGQQTASFDNVHSVALDRSQFSSSGIVPARVVPASTIQASMRASAVPILEKRSKPFARRVVESSPGKPEQSPTAAEIVSAPSDVNAKPGGVQVVKTAENDAPVPREAVFVIRTTQQIGPNSWVWSVTVWRLNWTSPAQESVGKVPVANKT